METKEKILSGAAKLFTVMGIRNVTMDMIAHEIGVSKRTIYELFKDKDELVLEVIGYIIIKTNVDLMGVIEKTDNVIEALFVIIERQYALMTGANPVFLEDMKKYFTHLNAAYYSQCETIKNYSVSYALLEKGLKQKIFRDDFRIDVADNFIHELVNMIHNSETLRLMHLDKNDILDSIFLPYFRGICTPLGLGLMEKYFKRDNGLQNS